jgi:glycosyltransferase involved in cell wall biosynthesis
VKIAFDSRPARDPRGIGRYVRCLLPALRETAPEGATIAETDRARGADVFHAPWIDGALLRSPVAQVVTLHDVIPLRRRSEYLRTGLRFRLRYLAVQRATMVIVPTRTVATDAIERLGLDPDRVRVVGEAAAPAFTPRPPEEVEAARARHGVPEDYLLWVGGLEHPEPRKRVRALAAAPRTLPLVLAGPASRWARELGDVIVTGHVTDDDLAALYTGARALVFASDDEGFGLPPVEALACGTPVAACDVPALREVLGGRATFVPRDDLGALVAAAEAARRPAPAPPPLTWRDAADATWDVYAEARRRSSR